MARPPARKQRGWPEPGVYVGLAIISIIFVRAGLVLVALYLMTRGKHVPTEVRAVLSGKTQRPSKDLMRDFPWRGAQGGSCFNASIPFLVIGTSSVFLVRGAMILTD